MTFRTRPLYSKDITRTADELINAPGCAIILQGPILKKNDFTLETVRIYKKTYPAAVLIVSTWQDEDPECLARLRKAGAEVVLNTKPAFAGTWSINFQTVSARGGIVRAKELGIPYIIKSRTDQRMYAPNVLETLHNLVSYFNTPKNLAATARSRSLSLFSSFLRIGFNSSGMNPTAFSRI